MKKKKIIIVVIIVLIVFLIFKIVSSSFSRYQSNTIGEINSNIAFYLAKTGYMTEQIKLTSLSPSPLPYVYTFSVANKDGNKTSDVDLSYVLKIITTTNIRLRYELYMNEDYSDENSTNMISSQNTVVSTDADGTYFQTFIMDSIALYYASPLVNNYTLLVYYDESVSDSKYQDTIESVRIDVDSRQIIE